jgi:hypothetical protein
MDEACSTLGEMRNAYKILIEMPDGKRPSGRPKHRWEKIFELILTI